MVIADFNIICLGAKEVDKYSDPIVRIESSDRFRKSTTIYKDNWKIIHLLKGIWYSIEPAQRTFLDYEHEFFDFGNNKINVLSARNRQIGLTSVRVLPPYQNLFPKLIEYYVERSPIKAICLLLRLQDLEDEIHYGPMPVSMFLDKLRDDEVMFNAAYFISNDPIPEDEWN